MRTNSFHELETITNGYMLRIHVFCNNCGVWIEEEFRISEKPSKDEIRAMKEMLYDGHIELHKYKHKYEEITGRIAKVLREDYY